MKKAFTLLVLSWVMVSQLVAQIPNPSPIPVEVRIESQDGLVRAFDYTSTADWGDTLTQTISADLVWAYGMNDSTGLISDSLMCDSVAFTDLTGKIALIRRGVCEFGWKVLRAEEAGAIGVIIVNHTYEVDGGALVNMGAGAVGAMASIPAVFLSREDGDIIKDKLDNGIPVTAIFEVRAFGGPRSAYSYQTPLAGVKPLEDIGITFLNTDGLLTIPSVTISAEITDPSGDVTTLSQTLTNVAPLSVNNVKFDDSYTPNEIGTYNVKFTNSLTDDELEQSFIITDYTYALDNGNIVTNTNGTIEPDSASFVNANFRYDFGNVYRTGPNPVVATHASFMISNPEELYTGDPGSDVFYINIYNADPDGNGSIPFPAAFDSYSGLNESGGPVFPIASAEYVLSDTDQGFEFITVEFPNPVMLGANKLYLVMIEYSGLEAGSGIPPKYAFAGTDRLAGDVGTVIFTDSLHTDGWGSAYNGVVRLHLQGFASSTDNPLEDHKVAVSPNPAANTINLELALDRVASEVEVRIHDFTGRLVSTRTLDNVQNGRYAFDVSKLANGAYFMSINTPEGFRSKKFQVIR